MENNYNLKNTKEKIITDFSLISLFIYLHTIINTHIDWYKIIEH